ncbi:MAG: isoprenylcysteine carboxylmethyltransferase family protein [Bacteroidota bacterium]
MDAINIISGIAILFSLFANSTTTKGGLKGAVTKNEKKPKTYLQKTPLNISALVLILQILGLFQIGTLEYESGLTIIRIVGLSVFILFSWLQVLSFKNLKENYSQEIVIKKNHNLITTGLHKVIRHPQYVSQIISDLGLGIALCSYFSVPTILILELPLFILRAKKEEELLKSYFGEKFDEYKKNSSFMIPFIG